MRPIARVPFVGWRKLTRDSVSMGEVSKRPPRSGTWIVLAPTSTGLRTLYGHHRHGKQRMGWVPTDKVPLEMPRDRFYVGRIEAPYDKQADTTMIQLYMPGFETATLAADAAKRFTNAADATRDEDDPFAVDFSPASSSNLSTTKELSIMKTTIDNTIAANKTIAKKAAYLEAGRIANNQLAKAFSKTAPLAVRGYIDTPIGKLVVANIARVAILELRGDNNQLNLLAIAMMEAAYLDAFKQINVEGFIDSLLETKELKKALEKLGERTVDAA